MARIKRLPDEYDPHVAQFIRAKLIVPKSKNLDKAHGGRVITTKLLKVAIESDDSRDQAFKLRPFVSNNVRFLVAITSYLNMKRKIWTSKKAKPSAREVVQGIPIASAALKKKVKKRSRTIDVSPHAHDYGREKSNIVGVGEKTSIDLSMDNSKHAAPNLSSDIVELLREQGSWLLANSETLIGARAEKISLQRLVSTKPPHIISQRCFTDIFGACVGYACTMDNEHRKVVELIEKLGVSKDQVKVLEKKVTTLEDQALLDVTYYNGLCFSVIDTIWVSNGRPQSFNWSGFLGSDVLDFIEWCEKHFDAEPFEEIDFTIIVVNRLS
uniref:Uncharacterized protein n=1 Tax=Cannabis sativa TaxID=3483 RepID=A0A803QQ21_CANSA